MNNLLCCDNFDFPKALPREDPCMEEILSPNVSVHKYILYTIDFMTLDWRVFQKVEKILSTIKVELVSVSI